MGRDYVRAFVGDAAEDVVLIAIRRVQASQKMLDVTNSAVRGVVWSVIDADVWYFGSDAVEKCVSGFVGVDLVDGDWE